MTNETPSRDNPPRQQSSERAQTSSAFQQGANAQRGTSPGSSYGQDREPGQGTYGQGSAGTSASQGTSTWQGGRTGQTRGAMQRGPSSMSPYSPDYWYGYGSGPFSVMRRISDEMDRFFESFGVGRGFGSGEWGERGENAPSMWSPHVEVSERNGRLVIQADLPGVKREDLNVRIEPDAVIIQGQRNQEQSTTQSGYYRSERSYGSFYRTIPLPEGADTESATATFRDGVLEIELTPPRQLPRGRTLEIREGGSTGSRPATTGATQQSASGASGAQQSSGSGTTYGGTSDSSSGS